MNPNFQQYLLTSTSAESCKEIEHIQTLWSGYGAILRYQLWGSSIHTVVVKHIDLSGADHHPRGWNTNRSHQRKVQSYQVEQNWYEHWNKNCPPECKTPNKIGSLTLEKEQWIILEDLNPSFPLRKSNPTRIEIHSCLRWLAHFHAAFLKVSPDGLWPIGSYWHLATRPEEWEEIKDEEVKSKAAQIDQMLNHCQYQTLIHGDAKLANFCFSTTGHKVAAVDFQYVGGGCGVKDVAYFLSSCLEWRDLEEMELQLLAYYFNELKVALSNKLSNTEFDELKKEWTQLYPVAWADFVRFLMGWVPDHYKLNPHSMKHLHKVLSSL